jgi:hypothetical protein
LPAGGAGPLAGDASVDPNARRPRAGGHLDGAALQAKLSTSGFAPLALRANRRPSTTDACAPRRRDRIADRRLPSSRCRRSPLDADGSLRIGALRSPASCRNVARRSVPARAASR